MCKPVPCACGKTTWAGCGDHIESVRVQVPADQWCPGHDDLLADRQIGQQQV